MVILTDQGFGYNSYLGIVLTVVHIDAFSPCSLWLNLKVY